MRARPIAGIVIATLLVAASPRASAGDGLTAELATKIIEGCSAHAKAKGQSHAIAVLDDGGHPVALLRMDGNPPGVTEFAIAKADAVAHWHFATSQMAVSAKNTPGFANAPHVVTVAGGIPVWSADGMTFVGAVGVSGEAAADDEACAQAGVKAAGLSLGHAK